VSRSAAAFTSGGRTFKTGAALVDGASLGAVDIAAMAKDRQTPITGLAAYPGPRFPLKTPKIGIYTGTSTNTANPIPLAGTTKGACSGGYCEALFTLTQKQRVPASLIEPITTADLVAGKLVNDQFTHFIFPSYAGSGGGNATITAGPQATALQAFVNGGGLYIGTLTVGATNARNAAISTVNTQPVAGISTPGSLYDGTFNTANPLSWGFDSGAWIYRDLGNTGNAVPTFDPGTLNGDAALNIPKATSAANYGPVRSGTGEMYKYGYDVNARGATQLATRPAVIDQPFGQGHSLLLGFNPFYRAWIDGEERIVLNALLYPVGTAVAPEAKAAAVVDATEPAGEPVATAKLPAVKSRPDAGGRSTVRDLRIVVKRSQAKTLKSAVKQARLAKHLRAKVRYSYTAKTATLVMRNVRSDDPHARNTWVIRIMDNLAKYKVRAISAQV
jgi:hypothetical protein